MTLITTKPNDGSIIADDGGILNQEYENFFEDVQYSLNASLLGDRVVLAAFTVATLPDATTSYGMIMVTDEAGGAVMAFSDLTNWRRCTDRAILS